MAPLLRLSNYCPFVSLEVITEEISVPKSLKAVQVALKRGLMEYRTHPSCHSGHWCGDPEGWTGAFFASIHPSVSPTQISHQGPPWLLQYSKIIRKQSSLPLRMGLLSSLWARRQPHQQILTGLKWGLEIGTEKYTTTSLLLCTCFWFPPTPAPPSPESLLSSLYAHLSSALSSKWFT